MVKVEEGDRGNQGAECGGALGGKGLARQREKRETTSKDIPNIREKPMDFRGAEFC